eukprot:gb/GECH01007023.1/.p1 GENE.gb/GECH01007023.1/~~gb/GECH01007023.1/.p1  ORF type:complete len:486 (+),score=99.48 gb/GECH01007023.1/:1-1458(+)
MKQNKTKTVKTKTVPESSTKYKNNKQNNQLERNSKHNYNKNIKDNETIFESVCEMLFSFGITHLTEDIFQKGFNHKSATITPFWKTLHDLVLVFSNDLWQYSEKDLQKGFSEIWKKTSGGEFSAQFIQKKFSSWGYNVLEFYAQQWNAADPFHLINAINWLIIESNLVFHYLHDRLDVYPPPYTEYTFNSFNTPKQKMWRNECSNRPNSLQEYPSLISQCTCLIQRIYMSTRALDSLCFELTSIKSNICHLTGTKNFSLTPYELLLCTQETSKFWNDYKNKLDHAASLLEKVICYVKKSSKLITKNSQTQHFPSSSKTETNEFSPDSSLEIKIENEKRRMASQHQALRSFITQHTEWQNITDPSDFSRELHQQMQNETRNNFFKFHRDYLLPAFRDQKKLLSKLSSEINLEEEKQKKMPFSHDIIFRETVDPTLEKESNIKLEIDRLTKLSEELQKDTMNSMEKKRKYLLQKLKSDDIGFDIFHS